MLYSIARCFVWLYTIDESFMRRKYLAAFAFIFILLGTISFKNSNNPALYIKVYRDKITHFKKEQDKLLSYVEQSSRISEKELVEIKELIDLSRTELKNADFWMRYLEPIDYKSINGPLPVEWETEVFEKFEQPYKRVGAGLTLAEVYLDEDEINKDTLAKLIRVSAEATKVYLADSVTAELETPDHFFLCNRLFLLNLAAIYTTGFECPDTSRVIPELLTMLKGTGGIYEAYNETYQQTAVSQEYLDLYKAMVAFVEKQPVQYSHFDHFTFIRDYVNPLYALNHDFILKYKSVSRSYVDYSLNKQAASIFDKSLYFAQNSKGVFLRVNDPMALAEIDRVGKLLFYDPILSGNNQRSCASCHKPEEFFTDTLAASSLQFDHKGATPRNAPSLINAGFNHLIMQDGKHISLQDQTKDVLSNPTEMNSKLDEVLLKVMNCAEYNKAFTRLLKHTPQEKEVTIDHIVSSITFYYSKFSKYYAPFDYAMNKQAQLDADAKAGFNLFMSKSQCATCHFLPQFNGVKPPYIGSEFEVLGVPETNVFAALSDDVGRYMMNPATETANAFRTGTLRNAMHTKPYMHNGVFANINEVIDFYDAGGGAGHGLVVDNQTLSSDSLHLSKHEKSLLVAFLGSLNEQIVHEKAPVKLPVSKNKLLNQRKVGGNY